MVLDVDVFDVEEFNSIFCVVYFIKGGSGIFGFDVFMNFIYVMENLLDKVCNYELVVIMCIVNVLFEIFDVLKVIFYVYCNDIFVFE